MARRLIAALYVLTGAAQLTAQAPPVTCAAVIGASESKGAPAIEAAYRSAGDLKTALEKAGLPASSIYLRRRDEATTDRVRSAIRSVLKDRASDTASILLFIAGRGQVAQVDGTPQGFLLTYDTNPGAKQSSAFGLAELGQMMADSRAAAIYLIVDLAGDSLPGLDALAKVPHVILSVVASGSTPDLPLAAAAARAFSNAAGAASPLSAGSLSELLKVSPQVHAAIDPRQLSAALFAAKPPPPPSTQSDVAPMPAPQGVVPQAPQVSPARQPLANATAQYLSGNCREALATLAGVNDADPEVANLRTRAGACDSKRTALERFRAVQNFAASPADLQQALAGVQSALAKNPSDSDLAAAAEELQWRVRLATATSQVQKDPDAALTSLQDFLEATDASPPALRRRLQPLAAEARKMLKVAAGESSLRLARDLYSVGNPAAKGILEKIRGDPRAEALLKQIGDPRQQESRKDALTKGRAALTQKDWPTALNQFSVALTIDNGINKEAELGIQEAKAEIARSQAAATAERAQKLKGLLRISAAGLLLAAVALVLGFSPKRRANFLFRVGWAAAAARLYARYGDYDRALRVCRSHSLVKPDNNEIRRVAADIQLASRDEAGAAESYFDLMRRGYGDESMYQSVRVLVAGSPAMAAGGGRGPGSDLIRKALADHPGSPALEAALADLYSSEGRTDDEALEVYAKASSRDPGNRDLLRLLARGQYRRERYHDALRLAKEAMKAGVRDPEIIGVLISASEKLACLEAALEFLHSLSMDALPALSAYEAVAEKVPALGGRILGLYREALSQVDGNLCERALLEAYIAIGENRFRDAEVSLRSAALHHESKSARGALIGAYRRILAADGTTPGETALELARLYGAAGDVPAAAQLLAAATRVPETQKAATSLLEEIYDGVPLRQLAARLFAAAGWTIRETSAGLLASVPDGGTHSGFEDCLVATFTDPMRVADADEIRERITDPKQPVNHRFAFLLAPIRPRHEVYAFLYSLPSDERPVWILPLDAPSVRKALVREDAREFLDRELDLWRGRIDLYMDRDAITDPVRFFGRERYFNELTRRIASHENFGIFGIRKIGKTSLAAQLRGNLQYELVGFADTQRFSSARVEEAYFLLIESLLDDARRKFPTARMSPVRLTGYSSRAEYPGVTSDFSQDVNQILSEVRAAGYSPRVLLIIDEIELLVPYGSSPGKPGYEDFFRTLRGLHQMNDHVLSAIMGADPSPFRAAVWGERDNPVFQYFEEIFLTGFDRTECDAMIEGIGRLMGIEYPPESLALIYEESGGHPFVARQLCSSLAGRYTARPLVAGTAVVEAAIEDYLSVKGDYFEGIFKGNSLSRAALEVLTECAATAENAVGREYLASFAARRNIARMELDNALQDLELFGLFSRERQSYSFKIRLLRRWIRRSWLDIE